MIHYRCFLLNESRRISDAISLECPDEQMALRRARALIVERKPAGAELWLGGRRVARLDSAN
jgi:1,2-phenylacetyl-CoA epoxidase PaaB subunit